MILPPDDGVTATLKLVVPEVSLDDANTMRILVLFTVTDVVVLPAEPLSTTPNAALFIFAAVTALSARVYGAVFFATNLV